MLCYNRSMIMGRFAPTPSGRMHLGNVYALLCAWAHARQNNGQVVLRIEDLDPLRCPRANADLIADDLRWLGLDWNFSCSESALFLATSAEIFPA